MTTPNAVLEIVRPSSHVAEVWLNRPDVRNAFNAELIAALSSTFAALSAEPALRVIVLDARHG
jgi:methylglutaconyl-CoA hydratase